MILIKIIIAGIGKVGERLTSQLSAENHEITMIDNNAARLHDVAEMYDVMSVCGNCATMSMLSEAGIKNADLLIAATTEDELNLLCCMTARWMNPNIKTIVRVRNPEYNEQIFEMKSHFALSFAVNPEFQAADEIDRLIKYPGFLKREVFAKSKAEIVELRISENSKLCNVSLNDMSSIIKCKILVCAVIRDGEVITPDGGFVLKEGDYIFVTALPDQLTLLLKNLDIITRRIKRVMLCGGGRVGYYLAQRLLQNGVKVKIVEKDYDRCIKLAELLPEADIVHGDASYQPLLESEGIADYDSLVTMMGIDELNMIVSLYGKSIGISQVITLVGHTDNSSVLDALSLGSIVSPKDLSAASIVRYVRAVQNGEGSAITIHPIVNGKAEALEFKVDERVKHIGEPLKNIKTKHNVLVSGITHDGKTIIPDGSSSFNLGDTVVVVTNGSRSILQLNDIFEK